MTIMHRDPERLKYHFRLAPNALNREFLSGFSSRIELAVASPRFLRDCGA
jgi:hypothetical protein